MLDTQQVDYYASLHVTNMDFLSPLFALALFLLYGHTTSLTKYHMLIHTSRFTILAYFLESTFLHTAETLSFYLHNQPHKFMRRQAVHMNLGCAQRPPTCYETANVLPLL